MALSRRYWVVINIIIATVMTETLTSRHDYLLNTREQRVIKLNKICWIPSMECQENPTKKC